MEDHKSKEMLQQITNKLGFDIREYNTNDFGEAHERDAYSAKPAQPFQWNGALFRFNLNVVQID